MHGPPIRIGDKGGRKRAVLLVVALECHRDLFQIADTPEDAFELLRDGLTRNHLEPEAQEADVPDIAQTRR